MTTPHPNAPAGNTHYAVLAFSGDPAGEHPDPELNGCGPKLELIACGPEDFCWESLARWTAFHPLRMWEDAEVLERHSSVVRTPSSDTQHPSGTTSARRLRCGCVAALFGGCMLDREPDDETGLCLACQDRGCPHPAGGWPEHSEVTDA